ncbi:16S rRNA (guanine(527)-N(7))-methyltransferase RsmG [Siphonobacter sp. BAB-5405]|uniref:16S rRNA (guanine(527)-N(7))-methyltransferase RsmG n=1 Tax=Siphonobacter sp. BAB-5405 TaxID=1864825 RepID=UPI000C80521F|nr:16S rRNA (guanine(527)-N(7))-methyltransferase RsmG [Siphonobacter sp. BAB-5405]PMD95711.1 16S rRNA (guanine(527)-N(7))-methyltransferase RsmG [Siphonobacter sp. BAB-5405]
MEIIKKYFPDLTPRQEEQFGQLGELYRFWNEQINVVSRQDVDNLYERHILHSLGIAKVMQFKPMTEILDVGTGGGFPGVPLAILFPDSQFHLVDSIGKKIRVVEEVSKAVGMTNLRAEQKRAELVPAAAYDFIVSRAVTRLTPFYGWVKTKVHKNQFNDLKNGILYLKGGDLTEELQELGKKTTVYELSDYFTEAFFETKKVVYVPF